MKYNLNKLHTKTTNNFKINDLEVDLDLPTKYNFDKFIIDNKKVCFTQNIVNKNISSKIGLSFKKYLEVIIDIPENTKIDETIIINYNFNADSLVDKIVFNYHENSYCNFIIKYNSESKVFHHLFNEFIMKNNSCGNVTIINNLNKDSLNFMAINGNGCDGSNITHNIIDLTGSIRVYNYYNEIYDNAYVNLNNIYIGKDKNIIDMNYYVKHIGKNSNSDIKVEGVLDDCACKNFRGCIDFVKDCYNSIGSEYENSILLSEECSSKSLPEMLCGEENVVGNHGVSCGSIPSEKLFYLESRGLSRKDAEKLIILANFNKIISYIPSEITREDINGIIDLLIN